MKILLVTTEFATAAAPAGGLGTFMRRFSTALVQNGLNVRILTCSLGPSGFLENGVVIEGVPPLYTGWMHCLHTLSFRRLHPAVTMFAQALAMAKRTAELDQAGEVDIVHATNLGAVSLFHPHGIPLVIRLSSDRLLHKKFGSYDYQNWLTVWQQHLLERRALTKANGIYSPSARIASVVGHSSGLPVQVILPPVFHEDIAEDDSLVRRTVGDDPFLLFVGRINRMKGIPILTRVLGPILERHPKLRMIVAGAEHHSLRDGSMTKELLLRAAPHSDRVILTGVLPHTQLYPFLKRAEAIVLPSSVDNLPNSLLEAMLHGRIVIGTRGASFDELITDGTNGILYEPGDPSSLEQAVERVLMLNPEAKRNIERAARARISDLSPSKVIPRIVGYLDEIRTTVNGIGPSRQELVK